MSVHAIAWAWEQPVSRLIDRVLLVALADFANDKHQCFPSQAVLADRLMCSADTVQRSFVRLEQMGFLHRQKRGRADGGRTSDLVTLNVTITIARGGVKPQIAAKGLSRKALRRGDAARLCGSKNRQIEPLASQEGGIPTVEVEGYAHGRVSTAAILAEIPE